MKQYIASFLSLVSIALLHVAPLGCVAIENNSYKSSLEDMYGAVVLAANVKKDWSELKTVLKTFDQILGDIDKTYLRNVDKPLKFTGDMLIRGSWKVDSTLVRNMLKEEVDKSALVSLDIESCVARGLLDVLRPSGCFAPWVAKLDDTGFVRESTSDAPIRMLNAAYVKALSKARWKLEDYHRNQALKNIK